MKWDYSIFEEKSLRFKLAEYLKTLTALMLILWLLKGHLKLTLYNDYMVYAIIGLIFAFELLSVGKWLGVTLSGIIFALAKASFWTSIFLFFGKWLGMSPKLSGYAGTAFAYAVVLAIAGVLTAKFSKERFELKVEGKAYEFKGADFGDVKVQGDGKAYPIKFGKKKAGWIIDGDIEVTAKTPLGEIRKRLISPVAIWTSVNIAGKRTSSDPAFVERANELINPDRLYKKNKSDSIVDLGFIKVYEGEGFEYVKLPFIEVIETPSGEEVRVGPIRIREGHPDKPSSEMLTIRELTNGFQLTKVGDKLKVQTEDYSIEVSDGKVVYKSGNESLALGTDYVSLHSGEISITVGRGKAKIRIEDVVISAKEGKVRIRVGEKSYSIESSQAYKLVLEKAKEIVEEQSTELIEGLGIDKAKLNKHVKELLDELMQYLG